MSYKANRSAAIQSQSGGQHREIAGQPLELVRQAVYEPGVARWCSSRPIFGVSSEHFDKVGASDLRLAISLARLASLQIPRWQRSDTGSDLNAG